MLTIESVMMTSVILNMPPPNLNLSSAIRFSVRVRVLFMILLSSGALTISGEYDANVRFVLLVSEEFPRVFSPRQNL